MRSLQSVHVYRKIRRSERLFHYQKLDPLDGVRLNFVLRIYLYL
jgi:hypothetical protein